MTIETLILAALIGVAIHTVRAHHRLVRQAWHEARWYERIGLLLALLPIPGPVDELVGLLIVRRVVKRGAR
jgi:hypothetical protein